MDQHLEAAAEGGHGCHGSTGDRLHAVAGRLAFRAFLNHQVDLLEIEDLVGVGEKRGVCNLLA